MQANFKETELGNVKIQDKVNIRLRMYSGQKVYHGNIVSVNWAVNRQTTNNDNKLQDIASENDWVLLPQRFPVLIKIEKPDPDFPLHVGASAYVKIET